LAFSGSSRVFVDGSAEVLDLDGEFHRFDSRDAAVLWLNEYSALEHLIDACEVEDVTPPQAENDRALVRLMAVRRQRIA
jgi:hypothetical protein